jgi:hypothetical protein
VCIVDICFMSFNMRCLIETLGVLSVKTVMVCVVGVCNAFIGVQYTEVRCTSYL